MLDQLELQLEDLEASATEDELAAEQAVARTTEVGAFTRKRPSRKPLPEHLPRERVIVPGPTACSCCGGTRLAKLGEDVTETLEVVPRQWKVIQHVREKFSCRDCESIDQAPAPFHVVPRGWAGPHLLAMILFEKYGQHQPLNCQAERYAREGVPLSLSTLADQVGACCTVLRPLHERLLAHVLAAERLHGDDTTVPVLAKGKTVTARCWTYVRDDRPFGGRAPPVALFFYSRDRSGEHPRQHLVTWSGILQADAYGGYGKLYEAGRGPAPVVEASCWAHARRKFFELADIEAAARRKAQRRTPSVISPIALKAVQRIDALFDIERGINGLPAKQRLAVRQERSAPLVAALEIWMREERRKLSRHSDVAGAIDYMLKRWTSFTLSRGPPHLPHQQRRRAGAARAGTRSQGVAVRRLRSRRPARCASLQLDCDRQAQRRRSPGLAVRCARSHRRASRKPPRRAAAVELGGSSGPPKGSLNVAAPSYVFTIAKVASMLGEDEALLEELALDMQPEDGRLFICDVDDDVNVTAFTPFGVECLTELLADFKPQRAKRSAT